MGNAPGISPQEALARARGAARFGRFAFTTHAIDKMDERNVQAVDVRQAMRSATTATWNEDEGTWLLKGGRDAGGVGLQVVVAIDGIDVRVVTVF